MNVSAYLKVDKAAFFKFVASQAEGRFEYEEGRIVQQMTGGTFAHSLISQRFVSAFEKRLDSKLWAVTGHSRGVETAVTVRYPDVLVEPMGTDHHGLSTDAPVAIVEVLSPTTEQLDVNVKPAEYMTLPSLEAYIVASQNAPQCWVWLRDNARRFAELPREQSGLQATVEIGALGISIPLVEINLGIFDPRS
jgi:Uma2 family endonuclease